MSGTGPRSAAHPAPRDAGAGSAPDPRLRQPWTLRRRLVVLTVGLFAVVGGSMGVVSTLTLRDTLVDRLDERLLESSQRAERAQADDDRPPPSADGTAVLPGSLPTEPTEPTDGETLPGPPPALEAPGQAAGTLNYSVLDGVVRSGYLDNDGTLQPLTQEQDAVLADVAVGTGPQTVDLGDLGAYRVVAIDGQQGGVLLTGVSMADTTTSVQRFLVGEGLIVVAGIAVAALAGAGLVRRELRPLERVAATATLVSEQSLDRGAVTLERVPPTDTDTSTEVGEVGAALNRLLDHVEAALAARHESETQVRQFVADASHELRTPLASIRGYAELVRRLPEDLPPDALRALERVESESRRMTSLVEDMLLLARLDAGRAIEDTEVDLVGLAVDTVSDAHAAGPDHVWRLDLPVAGEDDEPTPCLVRGDTHRLHQVLANLLTNARVHTPPGTTVTTSVANEGDTVVLRVQDDGPGIPAALRPRLFQRFTRGDAARSPGTGSTGLGMAIAHAVVTAHAGTIVLDDTTRGTSFTVRLPAA